MLLQETVPLTKVYPILYVEVEEGGRRHLFPPACFQDLLSSDRIELAGMGLVIIGNVCKLMKEAMASERCLTPTVYLQRGPTDVPRRVPWPGMPDDNPRLPLRPGLLPFDSEMFLNQALHFQKRVDRLSLMRRIEAIWVPWILDAIGMTLTQEV